jgi:hypothetical protein
MSSSHRIDWKNAYKHGKCGLFAGEITWMPESTCSFEKGAAGFQYPYSAIYSPSTHIIEIWDLRTFKQTHSFSAAPFFEQGIKVNEISVHPKIQGLMALNLRNDRVIVIDAVMQKILWAHILDPQVAVPEIIRLEGDLIFYFEGAVVPPQEAAKSVQPVTMQVWRLRRQFTDDSYRWNGLSLNCEMKFDRDLRLNLGTVPLMSRVNSDGSILLIVHIWQPSTDAVFWKGYQISADGVQCREVFCIDAALDRPVLSPFGDAIYSWMINGQTTTDYYAVQLLTSDNASTSLKSAKLLCNSALLSQEAETYSMACETLGKRGLCLSISRNGKAWVGNVAPASSPFAPDSHEVLSASLDIPMGAGGSHYFVMATPGRLVLMMWSYAMVGHGHCLHLLLYKY